MTTNYWHFEKDIRLRLAGIRVVVSTPYQEEWVRRCRLMGGKYRFRSRVWSFPRSQYESLARHLRESFQVYIPETLNHLMKHNKRVEVDEAEPMSVEDIK